jgi:prophage DNA circulation protein
MAQITEIPNTPWRNDILPASYRGAQFHVEAGARENGRRIVQHEFPKRDVPYAEDMGRKAYDFTVRGYCIVYPFDTDRDLYKRDYRISRDLLIAELERQGSGVLQLPLLPAMKVVVQRYRITEEQKAGGYCSFDITFMEAGQQLPPPRNTREEVTTKAKSLTKETIDLVNGARRNRIQLLLPPG